MPHNIYLALGTLICASSSTLLAQSVLSDTTSSGSTAVAPDHLTPSRPVARRIPAASAHKYFVDLRADDRAAITVTQEGLLDVAAFSPDGALLQRPEPPDRSGERGFVIAAKAPGTYRIELTTPIGRSARYEIVIDSISTLAGRQRAAGTSVDVESRDQQVSDNEFRLLKRATELLSSSSVWNRHDTRICLPGERKLSLFCALEKAQLDLFGEYLHRSVALQEVRFAIEDVTDGQNFEHRLMDFNNLRSTEFADIKRVLTIATHRIRVRLDAQHSATKPQ